MGSCLAKWATGSQLLIFNGTFQGIWRVTFSARKENEQNLETWRRTKAKTSFSVTQRPPRQGLHFDFTSNFMRFHTHLGKTLGCLSPHRAHFITFAILTSWRKGVFVVQPKCWSSLTQSELHYGQFMTRTANKSKKWNKLRSLLQLFNVHKNVHFSFASVCRCSLCIHSLWLVASLAIGKMNLTSLLFALYITIWYPLYVIRRRTLWPVHTRV